MVFRPLCHPIVPCLVILLTGSGCDQLGFRLDDNTKNAMLSSAEAHRSNGSYEEAVAELEKALEVDPRMAEAHWKLGTIYYSDLSDYAAAIYHFERYLKLGPDASRTTMTREYIQWSKTQLCSSARVEPMPPRMARHIEDLQKQLTLLTNERARLRIQVAQVTGRLERQTREIARLRRAGGGATREPNGPRSPADDAEGREDARRSSSGSMSGAQRQQELARRTRVSDRGRETLYRIELRDTFYSIARSRGLTHLDLIQANPGVDPRRLKVGQTIVIPAR